MKEIKWNVHAREFVRELDRLTKLEIGTLLMRIQQGERLSAPLSKPMTVIRQSAHELRLKDKRGSYRIIYVLNLNDKIFIPHAFSKKTQKTPLKEIQVSIQRIREFVNEDK